jgi:thiol-disulfide isomerase/thioredoxin
MQKKFLSRALTIFLGAVIFCLPNLAAGEAEPKAGLNIGNVAFSAPISAADAAYLGLAGPAAFTLQDIKSPYVVIESFQSTCPHCVAQAPMVNALYKKVAGDPALKDQLKFVAAAQGQDQKVAKMWKTVQKVPFAVVPDSDWKLSKAMHYSHFPVTMLVDKNGKLLWVHIAEFDSANEALAAIKKALKH